MGLEDPVDPSHGLGYHAVRGSVDGVCAILARTEAAHSTNCKGSHDAWRSSCVFTLMPIA